MSKGTLGQVVKRAISDAGFRRQLQSDPEGALKGFDLTSDERAALRSGDASKLSSLGIDQRMSKAFAMGEAAAAVSRHGAGSDLAMGATIPDGGEPLVSDALISGGGGRANDALIGEASGAKGARISDAGGSVRSTVTDGERLGQVNAAFDGGDRAAGRSALGDQHDIARAVIGDSAAGGVRSALGDQHDGGRSAIGGESDRLAQVNAAFEGSDRSVGTRALGDQDNLARSATTSGDVAGRQGDAFITADESGRDVAARGSQTISGDVAGRQGDAFITADEMGNDVAARGTASYPDSADTQREALANDTAMANPEGYEQPDPNA